MLLLKKSARVLHPFPRNGDRGRSPAQILGPVVRQLN
jgi:hypothetical protein